MASLEKLVARLQNNPRGASFDEIVRLLRAAGYEEVRVSGSHDIFRRADGAGMPLTVKRPSGGHVAPGAVRDVLSAIAERDEP